MPEDQVYFVVQKAFIRKGDDVLVLNDPVEGLDFPGGKIQENEENLIEALKREVMEETGLEVEVGEPFTVWQEVFPPIHKYAGKKAYIVAFRCSYVSGEIILSNEHDHFRWVNSRNYQEMDDGTSYFGILERYFNS